MFYGGRLLSHLSTKIDAFDEELIALLKINRNSIVVIDRDDFSHDDSKLNDTKNRINSETQEGNCWITQGREIENYLTAKTINNWLKAKYSDLEVSFQYNASTKLEIGIEKANPGIKFEYNKKKAIYAKEIIDFIEIDDFEILDLKSKMSDMVAKINQWN
jgi:hypothetical protein